MRGVIHTIGFVPAWNLAHTRCSDRYRDCPLCRPMFSLAPRTDTSPRKHPLRSSSYRPCHRQSRRFCPNASPCDGSDASEWRRFLMEGSTWEILPYSRRRGAAPFDQRVGSDDRPLLERRVPTEALVREILPESPRGVASLSGRSVGTRAVAINSPKLRHGRPYVALLLYPWVVWRGVEPVAPCLLLGFRAV